MCVCCLCGSRLVACSRRLAGFAAGICMCTSEGCLMYSQCVSACVWPACSVADGSLGDAPQYVLNRAPAAGGGVLQACMPCGWQWSCAGVLPCWCVCTVPCVSSGAAPSCRCWSWARRGDVERHHSSLLVALGLWPFSQGGCSWGLPCVQLSLGSLGRVLCPGWVPLLVPTLFT